MIKENVIRKILLQVPYHEVMTPSKLEVNAEVDVHRVSKIVKSFNTWAFKREQPDTLSKIESVVQTCVLASQPIHFILYWGKGPRNCVSSPESQCIEFLSEMRNRISSIYQEGARFTLILTDTHAALNGHKLFSARRYFEEVTRLAGDACFETCYLSDLVSSIAPADDPIIAPVIDEKVMLKLEACARKWYRGDGDSNEGAREYYRMNIVEKRAVEVNFPSTIFLTFNSSQYRALFPVNLPIFYMYSIRKGVAVKPWFMEEINESTRLPESAHD